MEKLKISKIRLIFSDRDFERKYWRHQADKLIKTARFSFLTAAFILLFFIFFDLACYGSTCFLRSFLYYLIPASIITGMFIWTLFDNYKQFFQLSYAITVSSYMGSLYACMLFLPEYTRFSYISFTLVLFSLYMLFYLQFFYAASLGFAFIAIYFVCGLFSGLLVNQFRFYLIFLITANIIGLFANYTLEYFSRIDFLNITLQKNAELNSFTSYFKLSPRESEILVCLLESFTYKEISTKMKISTETVKKHINKIYTKTEVHSKIEIIKIFNEFSNRKEQKKKKRYFNYQIDETGLLKLTLIFKNKDFERKYISYRDNFFSRYARYTFWIVFSLLVFYIIKDYAFYPFHHFTNVYFLYLFPILFIIFSLVCTYFTFFKKILTILYILIVLSYSYCLLGSMVIVPQLSNVRHLTLILIIMSCYVMTNIRFIHSSFFCFILIILFAFFSYFFEKVSITILTINLFFIFIANIIGMFFCYKREYLQRLNFLKYYLFKKTELSDFCRVFGLTKREEQLVSFILAGKSIIEIAGQIYISPKTVKTHFQNIYSKTGAHSKVELYKLFHSINHSYDFAWQKKSDKTGK